MIRLIEQDGWCLARTRGSHRQFTHPTKPGHQRAGDGGYCAWAPDLHGYVAIADDYDTYVAEMREAIYFHLDGMRADGDPIPQPTTRAVTITAA